MTSLEFIYWRAYFNYKGELEKEASKPKKSGVADREFKRTMGNKSSPAPSA